MDEATAREVLRKIDHCIGTMQSSNTKMLESISENLKNVAEMEAIKGLIKKSLPSKTSGSDIASPEGDQQSLTSTREASVTSLSSDISDYYAHTSENLSSAAQDTDAELEEHNLGTVNAQDDDDSSQYNASPTPQSPSTDEERPHKKRRVNEPSTSGNGEGSNQLGNIAGRPAHAVKSPMAHMTTYGTELRVSLLHPEHGKLEDTEFHRRFPDLWHQCIEQVKEVSRLSYWRSWINPKTRSCMQAYIKQRVPAKKVRWNDDYPHKEPCQDCLERDVQCVVLGEELDELIVLPRAEREN